MQEQNKRNMKDVEKEKKTERVIHSFRREDKESGKEANRIILVI